MSKALRCDICKTCFDPYTVKGEFVTIDRMIWQDSGNYDRHEYSYLDEEVNFCPKCSKTFSLFMSGKKLVEKELLDTLQEDFDAELEEKKNDELEEAAQAIRNTAHAIYDISNRIGNKLRRRIFGRNDGICEDQTPERPGDSE